MANTNKNKKEAAYRTTMPFDNRMPDGSVVLSPTTNRSILPTNNVWTIQDILGGRVYDELHGGGSWTPGEVKDPSYREKGNDYKRVDRDLAIIRNMLQRDEQAREKSEKWKVKVPGGSKTFSSLPLAQQYKHELEEKGVPFVYISRVAQVKKAQADKRLEVIADSINKCVMLESVDPNESKKEVGSAFSIGDGQFLTCAHVIQNYDKSRNINVDNFGESIILNLIQNGNASKANLVSVNPLWDIALIESEFKLDPFQITPEIIVGDEVIAIGSPHGYENNVSTGTIGSLDRTLFDYEGAPEYMFIDLSVFPGNSGGPVVRIEDGLVVGMVTLIIPSLPGGVYGINAALPSTYIREFLSHSKRGI